MKGKNEGLKYLGEFAILALLAVFRMQPYYGVDAVKYLPSLAIVALVVAVQYPVRKVIARRRKFGK
ncbi:hypothetical protein [Lacticaseibacillus zhaodongensis]|uniref:hypothetical protein n=1 Tax=Lacticaseibacillus zhaodongensis TaxID=2668065 RepID=UPI0012D31431|nr:hypothetical protein [Lacticaseibacillus zhaodongensis]